MDISKETYMNNEDPKTQKGMQYDLINSINDTLTDFKGETEGKIKSLENAKKFNLSISAIMGLVGGFFARFFGFN